MRVILLWLLLLSTLRAPAQNKWFEQLLATGKAEFQKDIQDQDYRTAAASLEAALKLQPNSAEAHYFLGYAYSRLSGRDGNNMAETKRGWTLKASQEFEAVNRLAPRYTGEMLALDPYCKLSSVWGALAMSYHVHQQPDSVRWALREGRKRGGFSDFTLSYARALLDECSRNGILISSGDLYDFSLWYVQWQEGYRRDVTVIDVSLLGTNWYAPFVQATTPLKFTDLSQISNDSTFYIPWETTEVSIPNARTRKPFAWTVHPSVDSAYLQRSDDLLLQLLFHNEFRRDVYFPPTFPAEQQLSLRLYEELLPQLGLNKLNAAHEAVMPLPKYLVAMRAILPIVAKVNPNSLGETDMARVLRYGVFLRLDQAVMNERKTEYKPLVALIDQYFPPSKYPFEDEGLQQLYDQARSGQ